MRRRDRLPEWLTKPLSDPGRTQEVRAALRAYELNTVCDEARCPNRIECFRRGTATFMILGDRCTRDCRFCAVAHATPEPLDETEPERLAGAAAALGLAYVVITSVTRDDLPDGGALAFARTVRAVRSMLPDAGVEVLVPDFGGDRNAVDKVLEAGPDVFGHNVETVRRLYSEVRPGADYERTLSVLAHASASGGAAHVKSAIMLGLGEAGCEIEETLEDIREAGVDIVYMGQYLAPSASHAPVARYLHPDEFEEWAGTARAKGFGWVSSGPFVRSSYMAEQAVGFGRGSGELPKAGGKEQA